MAGRNPTLAWALSSPPPPPPPPPFPPSPPPVREGLERGLSKPLSSPSRTARSLWHVTWETPYCYSLSVTSTGGVGYSPVGVALAILDVLKICWRAKSESGASGHERGWDLANDSREAPATRLPTRIEPAPWRSRESSTRTCGKAGTDQDLQCVVRAEECSVLRLRTNFWCDLPPTIPSVSWATAQEILITSARPISELAMWMCGSCHLFLANSFLEETGKRERKNFLMKQNHGDYLAMANLRLTPISLSGARPGSVGLGLGGGGGG